MSLNTEYLRYHEVENESFRGWWDKSFSTLLILNACGVENTQYKLKKRGRHR